MIHIARLKALQAWDSRLRTLRVDQVAKLAVLNLYQQYFSAGRYILQTICLSLLQYHRYDGILFIHTNFLAFYAKLAISRLGLSLGIQIADVLKSNIRPIICAHIVYHGLTLEHHTPTLSVTLLFMQVLWMRHGEMPV